MKRIRAIVAAAFVAAAFSASQAQVMMMGGGGAGMSQGMVLFSFGQGGINLRSDVAKELNLTDAQKSKLEEFQQKQMEEMMSRFQGGGERPSQEEIQKIMKKRQDDEDKAIKEILEEKQRTRLRELWIQRLGNSAMTSAELQKELEVTDDQKAKIKKLQDQQREAGQAMREKLRNGEIEFTEIREIMQKQQKVFSDELAKIMTDKQKDKLKTMGGTPFKFDEDNIG